LLSTAVGRAHLAFCSGEERQTLYTAAVAALDAEQAESHDPAQLEQVLSGIRKLGYASALRSRRVADEMSIAVPVRNGAQVLAVVAIRFAVTAVPQARIVDRFLPRLQAMAQSLRDDFLRTQQELVTARPAANHGAAVSVRLVNATPSGRTGVIVAGPSASLAPMSAAAIENRKVPEYVPVPLKS
jgi:hypothetical protein